MAARKRGGAKGRSTRARRAAPRSRKKSASRSKSRTGRAAARKRPAGRRRTSTARAKPARKRATRGKARKPATRRAGAKAKRGASKARAAGAKPRRAPKARPAKAKAKPEATRPAPVVRAPRAPAAPKPPRPEKPPAPKPVLLEGYQEIGYVTHYFDRPHAAVVKITVGGLSVGDTIRIKGHTTDFTERVESMQVDHQPVERAGVGDEVGLAVRDRVREHDAVYRVQDTV
jgi:putative protease